METVLRLAPKQSREGRPKVRTGCTTCKKRKIKCDEKRPTCNRCRIKKRQCEYVTAAPVTRAARPKAPQAIIKAAGVSVIQRASSHQRPLLPRAPSLPFPGSEKDHTMFQLFRDQIAADLGGTFGMRVFSITILRECHENDIIRNLVFSIAGLSRVLCTQTARESPEEYQYALLHQSRALANLRKVMTEGLPRIRLAVMAAALIFVYESCQGRYETARQQVLSGKQLMQLWKAQRQKHNYQVSEIDDELLDVFPRLDANLAGYATANPFNGPYFPDDDAPVVLESFPNCWPALLVSRMESTNLLHCLLRFMRKIDRMKRAAPRGFIIPSTAFEEAARLELIMGRWWSTFTTLARDFESNAATLLFRVGIKQFQIFLTTGLTMYECANDAFLEEWRWVIDGARSALEADEEIPEGYMKMCCEMEMAVPVFNTGTRCRDRAVREGALQLLRKYPRKQGLFDFAVLAKVLQWVIAIETEGLPYNAYVPEERRIRMYTLMWNPTEQGIDARCSQGGPEGPLIEHRALL